MTNTIPLDLRTAARERLEARAGAWRFLGLWGVLAVFFVAVWFTTTPGGYFWPVWPIIGIGVGVAARFITAYTAGFRISESSIDAEVARMQR